MTAAEFIIAADQLGPDGSLHERDRQRVGDLLLDGGFVLLPSDTSYSIAVLPLTRNTRLQVNILLDRPDHPLSLAFPDVAAASRWAAPNRVATSLLAEFSPGPITVVTRAAFGIPADVVDHALGGLDSTIGFRVPNSGVERSVAAAVDYPVTTVAVFEIKTFPEALRLVEARVGGTSFRSWCAIEGTIDYTELSTVVRVTADGRVDPVRPGALSMDEIEARRSRILQEH